MIHDLLANVSRYVGLGPRFDAGLAFLRSKAANASTKRNDIAGNDVFALVQQYDTAAPSGLKFEAHRLYADIHFMLAGEEMIELAPTDALLESRPYSEKEDAALFTGRSAGSLLLRPGQFVVLYPGEGHKPGCLVDKPESVRKVVVKVRL